MAEPQDVRQQLTQEQQNTINQEQAVRQQKELLNNPNALRRAGLGYLLSPAYKQQRINAIANLNVIQDQINQRQSELKNVESQLNVVTTESAQNRFSYLKKIADRFGAFDEKVLRRNFGLSRSEAAIVKDIKEGEISRQDYLNQQKSFTEAGLQPVVQDGRIVGFSDLRSMRSIPISSLPNVRSSIELKRLEEAGVISQSSQVEPLPSFTPSKPIQFQALSSPGYSSSYQVVTPTQREEALRMSIASEQARTQPLTFTERATIFAQGVSQRVQDSNALRILDLPFPGGKSLGKTATTLTDRYYEFAQNIPPIIPIPERFLPSPVVQIDRFVRTTAATIVPFVIPFTAPSAIAVTTLSGLERLSNPQTAVDPLQGLIELTALPIEGIASTIRYLREPITLKAIAKEPILTTEAIQKDVLKNSGLDTTGQFVVYGYQPGREFVTVPRISYMYAGFTGLKPSTVSGRLTGQQLKELFPSAQLQKELDVVGIVKTDPFKIKEGIIYADITEKNLPAFGRITTKVNIKPAEYVIEPPSFKFIPGEENIEAGLNFDDINLNFKPGKIEANPSGIKFNPAEVDITPGETIVGRFKGSSLQDEINLREFANLRPASKIRDFKRVGKTEIIQDRIKIEGQPEILEFFDVPLYKTFYKDIDINSRLKTLDIVSRANVKRLIEEGGLGQAQISFLDNLDLVKLTGDKARPIFRRVNVPQKVIQKVGIAGADDILVYTKARKGFAFKPNTFTKTQLAGSSELRLSAEIGDSILELYDDLISGVDITKTRFRQPRKTIKLKGTTTRTFEQIADDGEPIKILTPKNLPKEVQDQIQLNQKALQSQIGGQGVALAKSLKNLSNKPTLTKSQLQRLDFVRIQNLPRYVGGGGQGLIARQDQSFILGSNFENILGATRPLDIEQSSPQFKELQLNIGGQILRIFSRELSRSLAREVSLERADQMIRNLQRQEQRTLQRLGERTNQRNLQPNRAALIFRIGRARTRLAGKKQAKRRRLEDEIDRLAYQILIKRFGTFRPFGKPLPRGKALFLASREAQASLSRQFKLIEAGVTREADISFAPSNTGFRQFRLSQGKQIPLYNQFIQTTRTSLASEEEKRLIQEARRQAKLFR